MRDNINTYRSPIEFTRTPEQRNNQAASWARDDLSFFMGGACHILAFTFMQLNPGEGYVVQYVRPAAGKPGSHVYITKGEWAFDAQGWTKHTDLIRISDDTYRAADPEWSCERIVIAEDVWTITGFDSWCMANQHRLPQYFLHLPWERAIQHIQNMDARHK